MYISSEGINGVRLKTKDGKFDIVFTELIWVDSQNSCFFVAKSAI